jgi:hypothetical protein
MHVSLPNYACVHVCQVKPWYAYMCVGLNMVCMYVRPECTIRTMCVFRTFCANVPRSLAHEADRKFQPSILERLWAPLEIVARLSCFVHVTIMNLDVLQEPVVHGKPFHAWVRKRVKACCRGRTAIEAHQLWPLRTLVPWSFVWILGAVRHVVPPLPAT